MRNRCTCRDTVASRGVSPRSSPQRRPRRGGPRRGGPPEPDARRAGVVLFMTLLGLVLLASLIFYVINLGKNVQRRVVAQHAADAAAVGGATWVARTFNQVSTNNVEMARVIATINILDATDDAVHPAYHEADTHVRSLTDLYPSPGGNLTSREVDFLEREFNRILREYESDLSHLEPLKRTFLAPEQHPEYRSPSGSVDVRRLTFYNGPGGRGELWQALEAFDAYNVAALEAMPALAQIAAADSGNVNLTNGQAMLAPVLPESAWERGQWGHFERPVMNGLHRGEIDDKEVRRGPYDTVFGWRDGAYKTTTLSEGSRRQVSSGTRGSGPSGVGGIGPPSRGPRYVWDPPPRRRRELVGYRVYGPHQWILRDHGKVHFHRVPFYGWRNEFAGWKHRWAFRNGGPAKREKRLPVWLIDWDEIQSVVDNGTDSSGQARRIHRSRYYVARIESEHRPHESAWMTPGTFKVLNSGQIRDFNGDWTTPNSFGGGSPALGTDPRKYQEQLDGWRDNSPGYANLDPTLRDQWASAMYDDLQNSEWRNFRFSSKITRDGEEWYQFTYYFLVGIDVGEKVEIRNPHNWSSQSELPAPSDLIHSELPPYDEQAAWKYLTYLGVAEENNSATFWDDRFNDPDNHPYAVAVAQAHVFNNHSHDLWTHMWHAQLEPVRRFGEWADQVNADRGVAGAIPNMTDDAYADLAAYLDSVAPMAEETIAH